MAVDIPSLILASASPRRRDLLTGLGLPFTVRPAAVDETPLPGEKPRGHVERLAAAKAAWRPDPASPGAELVLGADTVVVIDGDILGKPGDPADAGRMLRQLAGREHQVWTGVALDDTGRDRRIVTSVSSRVRIAALTDEEIAWYVATGEPLDKAGAYAIQNVGALFVEEVWGNYTNVVGLPLPATYRLFAELGYDLRSLIDRS